MEQKSGTENNEKKNQQKSFFGEQAEISEEKSKLLKKIGGVLTHNVGWKLISLLIAFLLWMSIMNIDDPYITVSIANVPVTVLNENALEEQGKISDIESGRNVAIKVRAPKSVADELSAKDFIAVADYREMSLVYAVPIQISVNPASRYAREDISIETKSPEMMTLTLEDYTQETFRVDIIMDGEAAEGYYVADMVVRPNLLQISGSVKQIDRIEKVVAECNVSQASKSFSVKAQIKAYDKNGYQIEEGVVDFEQTEVEVEITVLPVKTILLLITIEGEPRFGYECTGTQHVPTEITIAGAAEDLESIYSMTVPFDISMQTRNVETRLNIEDFLEEYYEGKYVLVDEEKYVTVKATIEKLPTTDMRVSSENIEIRNVPEGYYVKFTNKSDINIKVWGNEEDASKLTPSALKLYIDVADYPPGNHYISVYSDTDALVREGTIGIEITDTKDAFVIGGEEDNEGDADPQDPSMENGNDNSGAEGV